MDDIVSRAMAKWPNVPDVYGWLSLNRRGRWAIKGEVVPNPLIAEFIARNYEHDDQGRWYFQNGPQRVFVALAYTPFIYRTGNPSSRDTALTIVAHTGSTVQVVKSAWIDDAGILLLDTELGPGICDDRDLEQLLPYLTDAHGGALSEDAIAIAIEHLQKQEKTLLCFAYKSKIVSVGTTLAGDVAAKFGFSPDPQPPGDALPC